MAKGMKIVFGVFDWGLGHATRDKPLVEALLELGHSVDFITTGRALKVLENHFGKRCNYFDVPSIASPYTKSEHFVLSFISNGPKMLKSLKEARRQSRKIIDENNYDLVISDCRYDVFGKKSQSFLINHQLRFAAPPGTETFAELWLAQQMRKYKKIIVPDYSGKLNLSGKLSHKLSFVRKKKIEYIGQLSHIKKTDVKKDIDYFITLTGPEPQRSILEEKVFEQVSELKGEVVIAGGNPDKPKVKIPKNVKYFPFLETKEMGDYLNRCKFFVSRSGYTTMMELVETGVSKALLIPTPGQTEQEYLGTFYEKKKMFHHVKQKNLDLKNDIKKAKEFSGFEAQWDTGKSVENFLKVVGLGK